MSKRQQQKYEKVYQDFTLKHLLYEPQVASTSKLSKVSRKPTEPTKTNVFSHSHTSSPGKSSPRSHPGTLDLVDKALGKPFLASTRRQVVNKALNRVRVLTADASQGRAEDPDFSMSLPTPVRLKNSGERDESYILRSTMSPQWPVQKQNENEENKRSSPVKAISPAIPNREIDRNRVLETRLKELTEKFQTLQRSYKDLLSRNAIPKEDYKGRYEELKEKLAQDQRIWEGKVKTLETELETKKSQGFSIPQFQAEEELVDVSSPILRTSRDELFPPPSEDIKKIASEVSDLKTRLSAAEERINVLERNK